MVRDRRPRVAAALCKLRRYAGEAGLRLIAECADRIVHIAEILIDGVVQGIRGVCDAICLLIELACQRLLIYGSIHICRGCAGGVCSAVSAAKAFITLGIGNTKTFKAVNIAVKLLCGITLIADVAGFYLYLA